MNFLKPTDVFDGILQFVGFQVPDSTSTVARRGVTPFASDPPGSPGISRGESKIARMSAASPQKS